MTTNTDSTMTPQSPEQETFVTIGKIPEDEQITVADTGWSEETRERMRQAAYDDMDMIRAWYS
ncbi:hypothetical protein [Desulfovibrio sp. ZJ200]|uniref:hypothetical protein n=1 Tax=Desulfovibrio sp. ZJ200 TaxID=2709792 RepID=UPI0013EAE472|nr:hypothetical protein [Desulfovibrio sp. ZJ200]